MSISQTPASLVGQLHQAGLLSYISNTSEHLLIKSNNQLVHFVTFDLNS